MIRRNSSSGSHARPRVLPPPTKPKPKRPRWDFTALKTDKQFQ
jgi:hypothetical protein